VFGKMHPHQRRGTRGCTVRRITRPSLLKLSRRPELPVCQLGRQWRTVEWRDPPTL